MRAMHSRKLEIDGQALLVALHETGTIDVKSAEYGAVYKITDFAKQILTCVFTFPVSKEKIQDARKGTSWSIPRNEAKLLKKAAQEYVAKFGTQERDYVLTRYHTHYVPARVCYPKNKIRSIFAVVRGNIAVFNVDEDGTVSFHNCRKKTQKELAPDTFSRVLWWVKAFRKMLPLGADYRPPPPPQDDMFRQQTLQH